MGISQPLSTLRRTSLFPIDDTMKITYTRTATTFHGASQGRSQSHVELKRERRSIGTTQNDIYPAAYKVWPTALEQLNMYRNAILGVNQSISNTGLSQGVVASIATPFLSISVEYLSVLACISRNLKIACASSLYLSYIPSSPRIRLR